MKGSMKSDGNRHSVGDSVLRIRKSGKGKNKKGY